MTVLNKAAFYINKICIFINKTNIKTKVNKEKNGQSKYSHSSEVCDITMITTRYLSVSSVTSSIKLLQFSLFFSHPDRGSITVQIPRNVSINYHEALD